jgi:hypothetical protein
MMALIIKRIPEVVSPPYNTYICTYKSDDNEFAKSTIYQCVLSRGGHR